MSFAFAKPSAKLEAGLLGILNSVPYDWQARRIVEAHFLFFLINLLCVPGDESRFEAIAQRSARLSCQDDRFAEFAKEAGVEYGSLAIAERHQLRAEIDALVAHAYGLNAEDLEFMFTDFPSTAEGLSLPYRALVLKCFKDLA